MLVKGCKKSRTQVLEIQSMGEQQDAPEVELQNEQIHIYQQFSKKLKVILIQLQQDSKVQKQKWKVILERLQQDIKIQQNLTHCLLKINRRLLHENNKLKQKLRKQKDQYKRLITSITKKNINQQTQLFDKIIVLQQKLKQNQLNVTNTQYSNQVESTTIHINNPQLADNHNLPTIKIQLINKESSQQQKDCDTSISHSKENINHSGLKQIDPYQNISQIHKQYLIAKNSMYIQKKSQ